MTTENRSTVPLSEKLVDRLGMLAGEPDGVAAVALSALGIADLDSLADHGIIEPIRDVGEEVSPVVITDRGRQLILAYSQKRK